MTTPIKPIQEMTDGEWRMYVSHRLESMEKFQKRQVQIWWGIAAAIGMIILPRFIDFVLSSGAIAGVTGP